MHVFKSFSVALFFAAQLLAGCGTPVSKPQEARAERLSTEAEKLWNDYVKDVINAGSAIQENCKPRRLGRPQGVPYKGVIILFHGFTACPQQYFEWGRALADKGFDVLLPLLPGHGLVPETVPNPAGGTMKRDIVEFLPRVEDTMPNPHNPASSKYAALAERMNRIASAANGGLRMVGGISVGGAVATHAVNLAPKLYDKALILSPFYSVDPLFTRIFVDALNGQKLLEELDPAKFSYEKILAFASHSTFLKTYVLMKETRVADRIFSMRSSWGEGCFKEIRGGRAGICDFLFSAIGAAEAFGVKTLDNIRPAQTFVQLVGVEDDKVASTGHMASAFEKFAGGARREGPTPEGGTVNVCFYRAGANHSLLSRFDSPDQEKFWLKDLLTDATNFMTSPERKPYAVNPTTSALAPYKHCHLSN